MRIVKGVKDFKMNPEKKERYKGLSAKAGLTCSCLYIVEVIIIVVMGAFSLFNVTWLTIIGGLCGLGAVIAAFVCVITSILGRKNPN